MTDISFEIYMRCVTIIIIILYDGKTIIEYKVMLMEQVLIVWKAGVNRDGYSQYLIQNGILRKKNSNQIVF